MGRLFLAFIMAFFVAGCTPPAEGDNPGGPRPLPPIPDDNLPPVKQEATCEAIVELSRGQLLAPTDALRRGRAFLVKSFATFMGTTAPDGSRRYMGVKGTFYPVLGNLETSSALYTAVCTESPMKDPNGAIVIKSIIPRPEIRIFNNNEYQAFQALAPESIWGDGTLDGSFIPSLEWNLGTGWRMTMNASRESMRSDLFTLKKFMDRQVFGGKGSLEIYEGQTPNSFVLVYTVDARVNGKPVKVRNELEYLGL